MKAGTAGGIEVVVKAIDANVGNVSVCRDGCSALGNMTNNGKSYSKQ